MKVCAYNIKYRNNFSIWTLTGPDALKNYVENGMVNSYGAQTAPTELELEVELYGADPLQDLEFTEDRIKQQIEEETGLQVLSFNFRYNYN